MHRSIRRFLFILFFLPQLIQAYQYELSIATIFRDEAPYLREWIEYHLLQGVEHFYLYNHLSADEYQEVLQPYIENGIVELIDWPFEAENWRHWDNIQVAACKDAVERATGETKWLAIIDSDEFLVPKAYPNIKTLLASYENIPSVGGICLTWVCFGTSNVANVPEDKLMIEVLTCNEGLACGGNLSAIWNSGSYKSIVRPERVSLVPSPHYCKYVPGCAHGMLAASIGLINHYWTRDETFFYSHKVARGKKWGFPDNSYLERANRMVHTNQYSETMLPFIPELKRRMNLPQ